MRRAATSRHCFRTRTSEAGPSSASTAYPSPSPDSKLDKPDLEGSPAYSDSIYVCGDHLTDPSLNGALASGRRAAAACLKSLRVRGGATPPPLRDYATRFEARLLPCPTRRLASCGRRTSSATERRGRRRSVTTAMGVIALNPEFRGSLKSLDGFDYVWVLAHMHLQTGKLRRFSDKTAAR